jgi:hypothetical protein
MFSCSFGLKQKILFFRKEGSTLTLTKVPAREQRVA